MNGNILAKYNSNLYINFSTKKRMNIILALANTKIVFSDTPRSKALKSGIILLNPSIYLQNRV